MSIDQAPSSATFAMPAATDRAFAGAPAPEAPAALPGLLGRSYARGTRIELHAHADAQLLFAAQGLMQVSTPRGCWFVPPRRAVWIPPRMPHAVEVVSELHMRSLLIAPSMLARHAQPERLSRAFMVAVGPLLRSAILACHEPAAPARLRELLLEVALYQLHEQDDGGTYMPLPQDARARKVAELVLADPAGNQELEALSRLAGCSARTVSRLFPLETELSFKAWRQRARIMLALEMLGREGAAVKAVAGRLGFSSVAAFSHAFRQVTGMRPSDVSASADPDAALHGQR